MDILDPRGVFAVEQWYRGDLIDRFLCHNDTTNEGKNRFLNVGFHQYTPITQWWLGIINNTGYTAVAATDTYANIGTASNAWSEWTSYTDTNNGDSATTRPLWIPQAASGGSILNITQALFTNTVAGVVKGMFVVGGDPLAQTKGNHTICNAVLWATALFDDIRPVFVNSVLRIVYTVNA